MWSEARELFRAGPNSYDEKRDWLKSLMVHNPAAPRRKFEVTSTPKAKSKTKTKAQSKSTPTKKKRKLTSSKDAEEIIEEISEGKGDKDDEINEHGEDEEEEHTDHEEDEEEENTDHEDKPPQKKNIGSGGIYCDHRL